MLLFSASDVDVCIKRFLHSSQSSHLPSSTFMDSAFLFLVFLSPDSGQGDGCCVMSVIALILLFSQHFNSFMLLPNLYWAIICILYMITFPLPVVLAIMGLALSRWLAQYLLLLLWHRLVNNNMTARPVRRIRVNKRKRFVQMFFSFLFTFRSLQTYSDMPSTFNCVVTFNYLVPACLRLSTSRWFFFSLTTHARSTVQQREY